VRARDGETIERLSERVDNAWNANETAVENQLFVGEPLREGTLVKIVHPEPYLPQPSQPDVAPDADEGNAPVQGPRRAPRD